MTRRWDNAISHSLDRATRDRQSHVELESLLDAPQFVDDSRRSQASTTTRAHTVTEQEWELQGCKDGDDVEDKSPLRRRVLHFEEESLRRRGLDIDRADITSLEKRLRWRRNFKRPFKRKLVQKVDLRVQSCISAAGSSISRVFSLLQLLIRSGSQCRHRHVFKLCRRNHDEVRQPAAQPRSSLWARISA
jgi:hypothetical protein